MWYYEMRCDEMLQGGVVLPMVWCEMMRQTRRPPFIFRQATNTPYWHRADTVLAPKTPSWHRILRGGSAGTVHTPPVAPYSTYCNRVDTVVVPCIQRQQRRSKWVRIAAESVRSVRCHYGAYGAYTVFTVSVRFKALRRKPAKKLNMFANFAASRGASRCVRFVAEGGAASAVSTRSPAVRCGSHTASLRERSCDGEIGV